MLAQLAQARAPRPFRSLTSLTLVVATLLGPACHDATAPGPLVPVPSFTIVSGNAQTGPAGSELALPIVAKATTTSGTPIAGVTLFFVVTQGGGRLFAGGGVTNSSGNVADFWTLGTVAGPQRVEVRAVDPTTLVKNTYGSFTATAVAGAAAIIKVSAGDGQTVFTRALIPIKPAVLVTDALGNPVAGVAITFAAVAGGGTITGPAATTNSSGVATVGSWRLGRGPGSNRLTATKAGLTGSPVNFTATAKFGLTQVATGVGHTCGLSAGSDVYCWGDNQYGQVGDGTFGDRSAPVKLSGASLLPASLALGDLYSCGLRATGKAECWGQNAYGQLGDGTNTSSTSPVAVTGTSTFTRIAASWFATCALNATGEVWCWGWNGEGEFGNGTTVSSNAPVLGAGGLTFKSIYRGPQHTCALTAAGTAWCWGLNDVGQLGDGTAVNRLTPALVSGALSFSSLELGESYTCGLISSGKAYCWGFNAAGQLGNGSTTTAVSPVAVAGSLSFTQIAAGAGHTCAITSTGVAYCWGTNGVGQLGAGTTGPGLPIPTLVAGARSFSAINIGSGSFTCAIPSGGGSPFCWGANSNGELGNGGTINAAVPVEVIVPPIP